MTRGNIYEEKNESEEEKNLGFPISTRKKKLKKSEIR